MGDTRIDGLILLEPWTEAGSSAAALAAELRREVGPGHPLFACAVRAVARREDNDDVLFEAPDRRLPYAVVHLTWRRKREEDPSRPFTVFFSSLQEWADRAMRPDHQEFVGGGPVS